MKAFIAMLAAVMLVGCGDKHQDLKEWMAAEEKKMTRGIPPLPKVATYTPMEYGGRDIIEPFNNTKVFKMVIAHDRPREPLEYFDLDAIKLVGIFNDKDRLEARVMANNQSFKVNVGSKIGTNLGVVKSIRLDRNNEHIVIIEMVNDADGSLVEKEKKLYL